MAVRGKERNGFDVAYIAVWIVGLFLASFILTMGADLIANQGTGLSDNGQLVIVSALGTIGTVAGAAMGYWAGTTPERERMQRAADAHAHEAVIEAGLLPAPPPPPPLEPAQPRATDTEP